MLGPRLLPPTLPFGFNRAGYVSLYLDPPRNLFFLPVVYAEGPRGYRRPPSSPSCQNFRLRRGSFISALAIRPRFFFVPHFVQTERAALLFSLPERNSPFSFYRCPTAIAFHTILAGIYETLKRGFHLYFSLIALVSSPRSFKMGIRRRLPTLTFRLPGGHRPFWFFVVFLRPDLSIR